MLKQYGVAEVGRVIGNFAIQFGTPEHPLFSFGGHDRKMFLSQTVVAPDALLNRNYPEQDPPAGLGAPIIEEMEHEHQGPKALMKQLILLQRVVAYVLGIMVYKRSGLPSLGSAERSFAAVALL